MTSPFEAIMLYHSLILSTFLTTIFLFFFSLFSLVRFVRWMEAPRRHQNRVQEKSPKNVCIQFRLRSRSIHLLPRRTSFPGNMPCSSLCQFFHESPCFNFFRLSISETMSPKPIFDYFFYSFEFGIWIAQLVIMLSPFRPQYLISDSFIQYTYIPKRFRVHFQMQGWICN